MNRNLLARRAEIIRTVRGFFTGLGFLEVDTPILAPQVIPESTIELFQTEIRDTITRPAFLLPSPELWMKRLLADGVGDMFQIARCFRNGEEESRLHSREFLMLEWYEVDADYHDAIKTLEKLLQSVGGEAPPPWLAPPCRRLSIQNAFQDYARIDLQSCHDPKALAAEADRLNLNPAPDESWDDLFQRIFVGAVEHKLPGDRPLILEDYPAAVKCLAKPIPGTIWRERWELYLSGVEIANCYSELTDYQGVTEYFTSEDQGYTDWSFPSIYKESHPRCTGTALGLDRLIMLLLGVKSVSEAQTI